MSCKESCLLCCVMEFTKSELVLRKHYRFVGTRVERQYV